jgi:hypothetical protein
MFQHLEITNHIIFTLVFFTVLLYGLVDDGISFLCCFCCRSRVQFQAGNIFNVVFFAKLDKETVA